MQKGFPLCIRFFGFTVILAACFLISGRPAYAATTDNVSGWLWSGTIGWISLNCTDLGTCGTADYGVTIDTTFGFADRGTFSGYAWSETLGWICFGATCTGPTPEGGAPYAEYRASFSTTDGVLPDPTTKVDQIYGWAQVASLGNRGWISLNCDKDNNAFDTCATSNYHVVLNTAVSSGNFTKAQANDHWAWNGNDDGTGIGWLEFTAYASTTWTPATIGTVVRPEGVFEPQAGGLAGTHQFTFTIGFENFTAPAGDALQCDVLPPTPPMKRLTKILPATVRDPPGLETLTYTIVGPDPIEPNELWYLKGCWIASDLLPAFSCTSDVQCQDCVGGFCNVTGKVCVADGDCAGTAVCETPGPNQCRAVIDSWTGTRPIFTHDNTWTGLLNTTDDQYLALKCNAGFPGQFFNNPVQCDFEGDASFSLAMRRGLPVEGNCGDGLDNDGNGQIDCGDRYCQGISYRCQTLAPALCVWGQAGDGMQDCTDPGYQAGDLCCTKQSASEATPTLQNTVNGLECTYGDPLDGYFDCDCTSSARFTSSGSDDCFSPGYQAGDLCCTAASEVTEL